MSELPRTFDESLAQMTTAVQQGIHQGKYRAQVEFRTPGLELLTVLGPLVSALPAPVQILFPDAGAAALASQQLGDWAGVTLCSIARGSVEASASLILVQTSAVEVDRAERLANEAKGKPFIFVNPQLDAGAVGIGLAGRQLRTRFLNTLEVLYFLEPLEGGALRRAFPSNWEIWQEKAGDYALVSERGQRPSPEDIYTALARKEGFFASLEKLFRALGS
ncbi:DUF1995 family protein [Candidatus Cyanaurora vandensis]|uniref:DUF1995 family protein n=1 Tax=Candidatus Cyanaurora vandensis TaxID=2714958 RepID=UPI00257B5337|nr:DUF1995 family protein [Candidatus Cyanaurora vandensis]